MWKFDAMRSSFSIISLEWYGNAFYVSEHVVGLCLRKARASFVVTLFGQHTFVPSSPVPITTTFTLVKVVTLRFELNTQIKSNQTHLRPLNTLTHSQPPGPNVNTTYLRKSLLALSIHPTRPTSVMAEAPQEGYGKARRGRRRRRRGEASPSGPENDNEPAGSALLTVDFLGACVLQCSAVLCPISVVVYPVHSVLTSLITAPREGVETFPRVA